MITEEERLRMKAALGMPDQDTKRSPFRNINKIKRHRRKDRLTMSLSLAKDRINMGNEAGLVLGGANTRLNFATAEYRGKTVMLIKPAPDGVYKLGLSRRNGYRVGTANLVGDLLAAGLPLGRYEVDLAKGGVIATPKGVEA